MHEQTLPRSGCGSVTNIAVLWLMHCVHHCRYELLQKVHKVHTVKRQLLDNMQTQQTRRIGRRDRSNYTDQVPDQIRDSNIELITIISKALEKEHEYL